MFGDLPVYSHNQACCLCTPRSFCSRSEMSPRDQTVTALAPGVLKTFILHSDVTACECWIARQRKNSLHPTQTAPLNWEASPTQEHSLHSLMFSRLPNNPPFRHKYSDLWVQNLYLFFRLAFLSHCAKQDTWQSHPLLRQHHPVTEKTLISSLSAKTKLLNLQADVLHNEIQIQNL